MKTRQILPAFGFIILFFSALLVPLRTWAQPGVDMPVESFYDELAPYGDWVQNPTYGRVWSPRVEADFQPYATNGHWTVTEYGNTWVSDYDWGWAPFHYGRWLFDDYYGRWIWVPDSEWGPAWVSWRSGGGYYGWAPLGPGMSINVNINLPFNYWCFVPQMYFTSPRVYNYCIPRTRVVNVYHNTTIINNVYRYNNRSYGYGPRREEIERYTRRSVPVYRANDVIGRRGTVGARGSNGSSYPSDRFDNRGRYEGNSRGDLADNSRNSRSYDRSNRYDNDRMPDNRGDNSMNRNDRFENRPDRDNSNRPDFNNRPNMDTRERIERNDWNRNRPERVEAPSENRINRNFEPQANRPNFERRSENRSYPQPDQQPSRRERSWGNSGNEGGFQRSGAREQFQQRSSGQAPRQYQERQNSSNRGEGGGGRRRGPQ